MTDLGKNQVLLLTLVPHQITLYLQSERVIAYTVHTEYTQSTYSTYSKYSTYHGTVFGIVCMSIIATVGIVML